MAKLADKIINDFTGGLVTNKADIQMADNELKDSLNLDLDELGRLKRRRGIRQFGDTKSGILDNSHIFQRGSTSIAHHLIISRASNATAYRSLGTYLTSAVATSDTTINVGSTDLFASSGVIEINGDLITYTAKPSGTTFTVTASTIRVAHPAFSSVTTLLDDSTISIDTRSGAYFAVLNDELYIGGRLGGTVFDGGSYTTITDTDEAAGLFATNYRSRIYVAGSGVSDGSGIRNGNPRRVAFTAAGSPSDWGDYTINNFDVEDDKGEIISGLKELNDSLFIFKLNTIFSYDEIQLKQRLWTVGAYNDRVIQRIGNIMYTFGPSGVFATNGFTAQKISDPVRKYVERFKPFYDTTVARVVINCFSGILENKYYLYLFDLEEPISRDDVVLIYDTVKGNWTVHDTYTNLTHFASLSGFWRGLLGGSGAAGSLATQQGEFIFAGDSGGKYFRLFENRFLDTESTRGYRGGDVTENMMSNDAGNAIQTIAETKFYQMGDDLTQEARVRKIGALVEQGTFQIAYRIDRGDHITDWISLGDFKATITERKLKENFNIGYRISFRITSNTANVLGIFNGIILKERETIDKTKHGIKR